MATIKVLSWKAVALKPVIFPLVEMEIEMEKEIIFLQKWKITLSKNGI